MAVIRFFFLIGILFQNLGAMAQKIVYSEYDRDENRRMTFEVIGKVSGNFLVYKNYRGKSFVSVYDNEMKQLAKEEQTYIPDDRLVNIDFYSYPDHAYMIYEYQKKNVVYCEAVKIDGNGKKMTDVVLLDTSHIGFAGNNKIYSTVSSEDKNNLMLFKVNSRNKSLYLLSTLLLDKNLAELKRSRMQVPMQDRDDYLGEFNVDNEGDFVFTKFSRSNNDNVSKTLLMWKPAMSDSLLVTDLGLNKTLLDEVHLKVDNVNKRYFLTSFYYKQKRGNIDGFYFYVWDKTTKRTAMENTVALGEELRTEARGSATVKTAFNDYFIRHIIIKKDGGFLIGSEAYYTTSRIGGWNRLDYLYGSPYSSGLDYYSYSPYYNNVYWRNRYSNQAVRYHADNVAILSFDKTGRMEWSDVIHKEQIDDESDDELSYQVINTGGQLHFLFNMDERKTRLLNDFVLSPDGQLNRNPTLKNLDRDYEFLPKFGKQVSGRQMIVPCYYRNYICFAKVEFN
ncbi:MAG: hypothetical protein JWP88_68 [Flaviaesturariibacter sp.]|nr:hypothetical protein [Flaviaesturariibacter sp.]